MQIAGSTCSGCGRPVVFAREGKGCENCGAVVHRACAEGAKCGRCGGSYESFERTPGDSMGEAIVPKNLRAARPDSSVALVFMGLVLFLFFFVFSLFLRNG